MRLVRIESERFGRIDARTLGDLSPTLTVVVGPNEAGKSSLTALVRHVLYGFPTPADTKEAPYLSASGKRQGRLVFADDDGEWVVERTEGPHGGAVTVRTLSGRTREGLADEVTRGVSRLAYRVVFGFGLSEMQQIEQLKGKDDVLSRLYAAGAGLSVSPPDIRAKLEERMESLWKKGGSNPAINRAKARRTDVRAEIRGLEAEADGFREAAESLRDVEERLEVARAARTETQARAERLARVVTDAERLLGDAERAGARAADVARKAAAERASASAIVLDADALAVADVVDALSAEAPTFRSRMASLADQLARVDAADQRVRGLLDEAGWTEGTALVVASDAGMAAEIESARGEISTLKTRVDLATEARDRALADAVGAETAPAPDVVRRTAWRIPGLGACALGVIGVAAGLAVGQIALTLFAAVLAIAGAVLAFVPTATHLVAADSGAARSRVANAEVALESAASALAKRTAIWVDRVRESGLGSGTEQPHEIAARLQVAREVRGAVRERDVAREAALRERQPVDEYVDRVRAVIAPLLGEYPDAVTPDRCAELPGRASARVEAARRAQAALQGSLAAAERLEHDVASAQSDAASARIAAQEAVRSAGLAEGGLEEVRTLETAARVEAEDALGAFGELTAEAASIRTRIDAERRQDRLALLRLEEETLGELIAADVRDYVVLALAARLLAAAQERYERERQPEVVKRAELAFARMTNGRYPRLTIPLGTEAIEVFDAASAATVPDRLSRGTAEQLYLALRLGLVDQLGEVGSGLPVLMDDVLVNFSPDRIEPAAREIALLSERRQVVFFTCHPQMADLLCGVAPAAVRISLEGPA